MEVARSDRELERVLATHAAALSRIAASYESRPALREELLQDIAFAIWRALPSFRQDSSERTFVLRIATNRALSHLAARQPDRKAEKVADTFEMVSDTFCVDPAPRPDELAARHQGAERLQRAVRALPLPLRQVVVLAFEGLDHEEAARALGITAGNVAVRLHRGKQLLKQTLGGTT